MLHALSRAPCIARFANVPAKSIDVSEKRLWMAEHDRVSGLLDSAGDTAPTFRTPCMTSACVSIVFSRCDAGARIFSFMGTELVLRSAGRPCPRESPWRTKFELLHQLPCWPRGSYPHLKFQLEQWVTAWVALHQKNAMSWMSVLHQALRNMVTRLLAHSGRPPPPATSR